MIITTAAVATTRQVLSADNLVLHILLLFFLILAMGNAIFTIIIAKLVRIVNFTINYVIQS